MKINMTVSSSQKYGSCLAFAPTGHEHGTFPRRSLLEIGHGHFFLCHFRHFEIFFEVRRVFLFSTTHL